MENLQVNALPKEFLLGAATAAYQVEGATRVDGKGINMWDVYLQENSPFLPDPASDFYYRYEEDIALAAEHGLQALRLSISWVRIFPDIDGEPNILAVQYYHRVFQSCLKHNVIPFVSLHHFDSPQKMLETGDWLNRENIDRFIRYARFCFQEFTEVKHWFTINELMSLAAGQYIGGQFPPNHHFQLSEAIQANHNMLLAHAHAVLEFHQLGIEGKVGCIHALKPGYPIDGQKENILAAKRYDVYNNKFLLDGTFLGYYSDDTLFHLNQILEANNSSFIIEDGDLEIMKRAAPLNTMFGMNYYRSEFIREYKGENRQEFNSTGIKGQSSFKLNALGEFVKKTGIPTTDWDWNIYPQGLFDMLLRIKEEYPQHPVIYLTENGTALKEVKPEGENDIIDDSKRIRYIEQHLHKVLEARDRGVNIQGYFIWSFQDQFSWANGYNKRYGLFFVDYETQKRYIKKSALWVKGLKRN